jgi:hypothetical protein
MLRFFLVLLGMLPLGLFAQNVKNTAIQLVARMSEKEDGLELSSTFVNSLSNALEAMLTASNPKAQEAIHTYGVKEAQPLVSTNKLTVYLSRENLSTRYCEDLKNAACSLFPILEQYSLKIEGMKSSESILELSLESDRPLNMNYLAHELSQHEDILMVEIPKNVLQGNDIQARRRPNGWILSYTLKTQSCGLACQQSHIWEFEVTDDGNINFITEYGDSL